MPRNYVYFVRNSKTREIKIGQSEDVSRRIKELKRQEGCDLELLLVLDAPLVEKELHKKFDKHRTRGEWFEPSTEMLEFILSHISEGQNPEQEEEESSGCSYLMVFVGLVLMLELALGLTFLYPAYELWVGVNGNNDKLVAVFLVISFVAINVGWFGSLGLPTEDVTEDIHD